MPSFRAVAIRCRIISSSAYCIESSYPLSLQFAIEGAGQVEAIKWDGKAISKPGIYSGIPLEVYHSQKICDGPSVSSTGLRRTLEINGGSPLHFWDEWSGNPDCAEPEDKPA